MATKKRTSKKKAGKATSTAGRGGKKAARKKTSKKGSGLGARGSKSGSGSSRKPQAASRKPKKNLFTINAGLPSQTKIWSSVSRWKRRTPKAGKAKASLPAYTIVNPGLRSQTKLLLPSAESNALVKAYEQASAPPRSGPAVGAPGGGFARKDLSTWIAEGGILGKKGKKGKAAKKAARKASASTASKKPRKTKKATGKKTGKKKAHLSREEFLSKMEAGRAAAKKAGKKSSKKSKGKASKKKRKASGGRPAGGGFAEKMAAARSAKASKRSARKGAGKSTKKMSAKKASSKRKASKSIASSPARKRAARKGWPKAGANERTWKIPKLSAMQTAGLSPSRGAPPSKRISKEKTTMLRESAGRGISAKQVFEMARATNQKAWICAGRVRTGCGGGSKMLQGSHQIGVFGVGRR